MVVVEETRILRTSRETPSAARWNYRKNSLTIFKDAISLKNTSVISNYVTTCIEKIKQCFFITIYEIVLLAKTCIHIPGKGDTFPERHFG